LLSVQDACAGATTTPIALREPMLGNNGCIEVANGLGGTEGTDRSVSVQALNSAAGGTCGVWDSASARGGNSRLNLTASGSAGARKTCSRSDEVQVDWRSPPLPTWKLGGCKGRKSVTHERGGMGRAPRMRAGIPEPRLGGRSCQRARGGQGNDDSSMVVWFPGVVFWCTGFSSSCSKTLWALSGRSGLNTVGLMP